MSKVIVTYPVSPAKAQEIRKAETAKGHKVEYIVGDRYTPIKVRVTKK